jgi:hypothetical protein
MAGAPAPDFVMGGEVTLFTFFPGRLALAIAPLCFGLVTAAPVDARATT